MADTSGEAEWTMSIVLFSFLSSTHKCLASLRLGVGRRVRGDKLNGTFLAAGPSDAYSRFFFFGA